MAPTVKEPDQQNSAVSVSQPSAAQPRVQPVALEIAVTVNGARSVDGSDKREPFSETTQTVLVFGNGAVIRLNSGVTPGQLLFLTNEKTKKEVVCQVVKSKNYRSMSGYVELEFTEPAVGFWGMRFPSDRVAPAPATTGNATAPVKPAPVEPKSVAPVVSAAQARPAVPPAPIAAVPPAAPVVAATLNSPTAEIKPDGPTAVVSEAASIVTATADNSTEELKKQTSRLQEQLSSMLFEETPAPPPTPDKPILQLDAIAMSEATAKIFEMATPEGTPAQRKTEPAVLPPAMPPAKSSEQVSPSPIARNDKPASFLNETEVKIPTPIARNEKTASFLNEQEVKIPAWLEPLARNTATSTPATSVPVTPPPPPPSTTSFDAPVSSQITPSSAPADAAIVAQTPMVASLEVTELEDARVPSESHDFVSVTEAVPPQTREVEAPNFGTSLFESNEDVSTEPVRGGSRKGLWIGAIAATLLLAAGGGYWYMLWQGHTAASAVAAISQSAPQFSTQPQQQVPQNLPSSSAPTNDNASVTPSQVNSQSLNKPTTVASPAAEVRKIAGAHESPKPATSSAASRAAEPVAQPVEEKRNPAFNKMRLATPTLKDGKAQSTSNEPEPGIAIETETNSAQGALSSGLVGSKGNQPAAPVPIGGDVTSAQLISSVPPAYPQIARSQRVSGDVKIDALIDESGRVSGMKVVSGPVMLQQAAMDALRQWKYKPATLNGKPVSMHLVVTLQFRLQ